MQRLYNNAIRIATILSDMDAEIVGLETKLEKYKQVKLGMMQELLTGKYGWFNMVGARRDVACNVCTNNVITNDNANNNNNTNDNATNDNATNDNDNNNDNANAAADTARRDVACNVSTINTITNNNNNDDNNNENTTTNANDVAVV